MGQAGFDGAPDREKDRRGIVDTCLLLGDILTRNVIMADRIEGAPASGNVS